MFITSDHPIGHEALYSFPFRSCKEPRKTETHKRTRALTEAMIHTKNTLIATFLALLVCTIAGCSTADFDRSGPQQYPCDQFEDPIAGLPDSGQRVHIHGRVTGAASAEATVSLFSSKNVSLAAALHTVTTERPIQQINLNDGKTFTFDPVPAGCYIVAIPGQAFGRAQGFPVINETGNSRMDLEMLYHGGDIRQSIAGFVIRPREDSVGATDQVGGGGAK